MQAVAGTPAPLPIRESFAHAMQQCAPFERAPHVAVAVSGGPDSMALALLARDWAAEQGGDITALIVDHGLRPESSAEALQVMQWLAQAGVRAEILPLHLTATTSAMQEKARAARYAMLAGWCKEHHVLHLLLGHHADDQAETVVFRLMRGSGMTGLSGMALQRESGDMRMLRPLLGVRKSDCKSFLSATRQPWVQDPSNQNRQFARTRIRQQLSSHGEASSRHLRAIAESAGSYRHTQETRVAERLMQSTQWHSEGFVTYRRIAGLSHLDEAEVLKAIFSMLRSGGEDAPRAKDIQRLIDAMDEEGIKRRTLSGCVIEKAAGEGIYRVYREVHYLTARVPLDRSLVEWHGYKIKVPQSLIGQGLWIAKLGATGLKQVKPHLIEQGKPAALPPFRIAQTFPALWQLDVCLAAPHIGYDSTQSNGQTLTVSFCPAKPLAGAPFYAMNKRY